jgi:hypothetical protein
VSAFIESIGSNRWKSEVFDEGLNQISNKRLTGPSVKGFLTNGLQFIPLAQIGRKGNHVFHSPFLLEVGNANAGINPAGVGEHNLFRAAHQRLS